LPEFNIASKKEINKSHKVLIIF